MPKYKADFRLAHSVSGSGIGALSDLLDRGDQSKLFPDVRFPDTHNTAVLRAAYIFSHLM